MKVRQRWVEDFRQMQRPPEEAFAIARKTQTTLTRKRYCQDHLTTFALVPLETSAKLTAC
jgi:hypothetical protein